MQPVVEVVVQLLLLAEAHAVRLRRKEGVGALPGREGVPSPPPTWEGGGAPPPYLGGRGCPQELVSACVLTLIDAMLRLCSFITVPVLLLETFC